MRTKINDRRGRPIVEKKNDQLLCVGRVNSS